MIRIRFVLLLVSAAACGGRSTPAADVAGNRAAPSAAVAGDPLCCCTFSFAEPVDFPDVATWDSLAATCLTGDGAARAPGQCIDWRWCDYAPGQEPRSLADRPDLAPEPPMPEGSCCCDWWQNEGETFAVLEAGECASRPYGTCVDAGFC
jgi:hypothetical protein